MLALSQLSYGPGSGGRLARVIAKREPLFAQVRVVPRDEGVKESVGRPA
jgi:hypothetical protein